MEKEKLLERIIDRFGPDVQIRKIKEECLELALAITKLDIPTKDASETIENIYEEIADVQIMMEQADKIFDKEKIERIKKMKLDKAEKSDWLNKPLNPSFYSKSYKGDVVKKSIRHLLKMQLEHDAISKENYNYYWSKFDLNSQLDSKRAQECIYMDVTGCRLDNCVCESRV